MFQMDDYYASILLFLAMLYMLFRRPDAYVDRPWSNRHQGQWGYCTPLDDNDDVVGCLFVK